MDGIEIKCNAHIKQFIQSMKREQPAGCFIYDFPGSKEAVESVLQNVITYLNGNDDVIVKFSFYYRDSYKAGRFVFIGDLNQIDGVIKILNERKK